MQLDKVLFKITGEANVKLDNDDRNVLESSFVDYKGDFDQPKSLNLAGIKEWAEDLAQLRKSLKAGRGVQISYLMTPIKAYASEVDIMLFEIGASYINDVALRQAKLLETKQCYN